MSHTSTHMHMCQKLSVLHKLNIYEEKKIRYQFICDFIAWNVIKNSPFSLVFAKFWIHFKGKNKELNYCDELKLENVLHII